MTPLLDLYFVWDKLKLLLLCICLPYFASGTCPGDVKGQIKNCFRDYEMKIEGILTPGNSIISGVDAENIRLLCTGFKYGEACVASLKSKCLQDTAIIEAELLKLTLAEEELKLLCRDDSLYDVYARNRYCYEKSGIANEKCFRDVMNSSVRIITDLDQRSVTGFCGDVDSLLNCIGGALHAEQCSKESITQKDKLVRPLIRGSQECDKSAYTVSSQKTTPSQLQNGRQSGTKGSDGTNTADYCLANRTLILSLLVVFSLVLGFS
ncbi:uncharacterized protein LOC133203437 [Saccostrea echinata]|uniref:uncharacterized protein LOC133203437 n=1 Tax=Saccostrea echinata TaxID=191078 RepID=UPI002A7EC1DA|nr:uncharacterized protein LOC133203437 [Saccostrea echinata]